MENLQYNTARELKVTQYDLEIWDWKTSSYIADISNIVVGGLSFSWTLNDVETLDFSIDLVQFEKRCEAMGVSPEEILAPYVHDIRIRRNGEYILGCQVVETNIDIQNNSPVTIQVRCTGFLNLFKDRYITCPLASYYPSAIAQELVTLSQQEIGPAGLVKNPTADIDRSYWLAPNGIIDTPLDNAFEGDGYVRVNRTGTGWMSGATQVFAPAGSVLKGSVFLRAQPNLGFKIREREYASYPDNQIDIAVTGGGNYNTTSPITPNANYNRYTFSWRTTYDNPYIIFEQERTSTAYAMWLDNLYIVYSNQTGRDFNVSLGEYSVNNSGPKVKRDYQQKNVKDALLELTSLEPGYDSIDFSFSPDRKFNVYSHLGTTKAEIEASYPGNIHSMSISRSASALSNYILDIGSGIGSERVEATAIDTSSCNTYGARESIITNNNASLTATLKEEANGRLQNLRQPTNLPKVVIRDGSINPTNTQIGDTIRVNINNGDEYLATVSGYYRVVEYEVQVDSENVETTTLTLGPQ